MKIEEAKIVVKAMAITLESMGGDARPQIDAINILLNYAGQLEEQNRRLKKKEVFSKLPGLQ